MANLKIKSTLELEQQKRREKSLEIRIKAAFKAYERGLVNHVANGDEKLPKRMMSFTKGLPHDYDTGLLHSEGDFDKFIKGICSGDPEVIKDTPLGPLESYWRSDKGKQKNKIRGWESSGAGLVFDLQAPDAQSVTMPPAPKLGSDELNAELAEVYAHAILRDVPFSTFETEEQVAKCLVALNKLDYFKGKNRNGQELRPSNVFRGFAFGDQVGPYISQFLLAGNNGFDSNGNEFKASDGFINYGAIRIDQRVRNATSQNYMTTWDEYMDTQNAADFGGLETYVSKGITRKFVTTGRDLATYVHYDALYQAYLNACLILLGEGAAFDIGVPYQGSDEIDKQKGFAHFGPPHILTLVTEVATRALKAVRYQKFNIHRRLRPEALAARMEKKKEILSVLKSEEDKRAFESTFNSLGESGIFGLLPHNNKSNKNKLLPMAYCEGSPMHPSYGAGHATVAGACVTILKAFFDHKQYVNVTGNGNKIEFPKTEPKKCKAFVPSTNGNDLEVKAAPILTLEGELNKLAANISIGRNWAGVHYYSDYTESLLLGEEIAIGLLEEQALTYNSSENFYLTLPKFKGNSVRIDENGVTPLNYA